MAAPTLAPLPAYAQPALLIFLRGHEALERRSIFSTRSARAAKRGNLSPRTRSKNAAQAAPAHANATVLAAPLHNARPVQQNFDGFGSRRGPHRL